MQPWMLGSFSMIHCPLFCRVRLIWDMMSTVVTESTSLNFEVKKHSITPPFVIKGRK